MRKNIITILLGVMISFAAKAQNDVKAREEFTEAQNDFDESNFDKALEHLNSAQQLLGVWSPKISHLKIATLDNMCNYASPENMYTKQQQKEVAQYLKTATNKKDDKFTFVEAINKKLALLKKIEQDRASEEYKSAIKLLEQKNYAERISVLTKAAAKGNLLAMYDLASNHEYSNRGQNVDPVAAYEGYKSLVQKGYFPAAYSLGIYSSIGYGNVTKEDETEAVKWYKIAADWDKEATYKVATAYDKGEGVSKDCRAALQWFKRAAYQGEIKSYDNVGRLYQDDCLEDSKSYAEAMAWYKKGVEKGNIYSYGGIASMYENGQGVPKDPEMAIEWYKKGAELDDYPKQQLGTYYYNQKNFEGAVEWLTKYLDKEDLLDYRVAYDLGEVYYYGGFEKGVFTSRQDPEKAILYLTRAANKGRKLAIGLLVEIYKNGKNGFKKFKDAHTAKEWEDKLATL